MPFMIEKVAGILGVQGRKNRPMSPFELIQCIENGLPITILDRIARLVAPSDTKFKYLIVSHSTLDRRRKSHGRRFSPAESERLVRLARVWVFARDVWGTEQGARAFLFRPHMMLEDRTPMELVLKTEMGARLVEDILGRLKYGAAA